MNPLDIILGIVLISGLIFGYVKGILTMLVNLIGFIVSIVLLVKFGPLVQIGMINKFEINSSLAAFLSYTLIFIVIMLIIKIVIVIVNKLVNILNLNVLNRLLGAIFGFANSILMLTFIYIIIGILPNTNYIMKYIHKSEIGKAIKIVAGELSENIYNKIPQPNINPEEIKKKVKKLI